MKFSFYIENLGCAKNQVDAEILIASLNEKGHSFTENADEADLIIINTCGFIETARQESIDTLLESRARYPGKKILLSGCLAQRYGDDLLTLLPETDGVFGNKDLSGIEKAAADTLSGRREAWLPEEFSPYRSAGTLPRDTPSRTRFFSFPGSVYVKISEGCSHRCSYCAIPLIRGDLKSRGQPEIIREIRDLIEKGAFEINLIAQDLAAYGDNNSPGGFPGLLGEISSLSGDFRIRLLYIHPDNFPLSILEIIRKDPRMLSYFDIPFQHASRKILERMGRKNGAPENLKLIETIRTALPNAVIRSTFMTGFPGEKEKEFRELEGFIREAQLDWAGFFTFSREEGTRAARMRGPLGQRLSEKKAAARKELLAELQTRISEERMERFVGEKQMILLEERVKGEALLFGRGYLQAPEIDGTTIVHTGSAEPDPESEKFKPGDRILCRIIKRNGFDLEAVPL